MYLTVQRVSSPRHDRGINGAIYLHESDRRDPRWSPPDLRAIVGGDLGRQVVTRVDVAPGGNAVESFLDIACPDDVSIVELRDALEHFRQNLSKPRQLDVQGLFALELSVNVAADDNHLSWFSELRDAALDLFARPRDQPWLHHDPLIIRVEVNDNGSQFTLDDASRNRLASRFGADLPVARISVPFDVESQFKTMYGELYPFVVEGVTSKPRNELLSLGGVRVVHKGKTLWEWPRRPA